MTNPRLLPLLLILALTLTAGCAGSRKAAKEAHPLVGTWAYTIDTPQGIYKGFLLFTEVDDMLQGAITGEVQEDGGVPLEKITFEENTLTCDYENPEYGRMTLKVALEGDNLGGNMTVHAFSVDVPFMAVRKVVEK